MVSAVPPHRCFCIAAATAADMPLSAESPFDTINILPRPAPASSELASLVHDAGRLVVQARDTWGPAKSRPIQVQCAALPARKRSTLDISTLRAPHPGPNPDLAKFDWFGRTTVRVHRFVRELGH